MKKTFSYLAVFMMLAGCKTFDPILLNPTGNSFNQKLPAMEHAIENTIVTIVNAHGDVIGASPLDINTYFEREVDEVMTNPYGAKKGVITLKVTNLETRFAGMGFLELDAFTLFIPSLAGMPYYGALSSLEVEILITNSQNELLGKYRGSGRIKFYSSFYNGKNYQDGVRIAYLLAVKQAVEDAKTKMIPDLNRLNAALSK